MKQKKQIIIMCIIIACSILAGLVNVYIANTINDNINGSLYRKGNITGSTINYHLNGYSLISSGKFHNNLTLTSVTKATFSPKDLGFKIKTTLNINDDNNHSLVTALMNGKVSSNSIDLVFVSGKFVDATKDGEIVFPSTHGTYVKKNDQIELNLKLDGPIVINNKTIGATTSLNKNTFTFIQKGNETSTIITNGSVNVGALAVAKDQKVTLSHTSNSGKHMYSMDYTSTSNALISPLEATFDIEQLPDDLHTQILLLATNALEGKIDVIGIQGKALEIVADGLKYGASTKMRIQGKSLSDQQPLNLNLSLSSPENSRGNITKSNAFSVVENMKGKLTLSLPYSIAMSLIPVHLLNNAVNNGVIIYKNGMFTSDLQINNSTVHMNGNTLPL